VCIDDCLVSVYEGQLQLSGQWVTSLLD